VMATVMSKKYRTG